MFIAVVKYPDIDVNNLDVNNLKMLQANCPNCQFNPLY